MEISSGYMKLYLLKNLPAEKLLLLFCVLCIYKYVCETHSFVVNRCLFRTEKANLSVWVGWLFAYVLFY